MSAPIDWSRPIELDTVPPRPARVLEGPDNDGDYWVQADWAGTAESRAIYVTESGNGRFSDYDPAPRVRNVAPPTDDVTAELLAALREIADLPGEINPSNYDHDDACELNRQFCYAITVAADAIARAEARK